MNSPKGASSVPKFGTMDSLYVTASSQEENTGENERPSNQLTDVAEFDLDWLTDSPSRSGELVEFLSDSHMQANLADMCSPRGFFPDFSDGLITSTFRGPPLLPSPTRGSSQSSTGRTCMNCRKAKVKCDKKLPCERCIRLKLSCVPAPPSQRGKTGQSKEKRERNSSIETRLPPKKRRDTDGHEGLVSESLLSLSETSGPPSAPTDTHNAQNTKASLNNQFYLFDRTSAAAVQMAISRAAFDKGNYSKNKGGKVRQAAVET